MYSDRDRRWAIKVFRGCEGKRRFGEFEEAMRRSAEIHQNGGPKLRAYQCWGCGGYHLTRQWKTGPVSEARCATCLEMFPTKDPNDWQCPMCKGVPHAPQGR